MLVSWNRNRLAAKLGIDYPIIQGPLGGLSSQQLTAAVSNFGGLGSFGAHALALEAIKDVIAQICSGGCSMSLQRTWPMPKASRTPQRATGHTISYFLSANRFPLRTKML